MYEQKPIYSLDYIPKILGTSLPGFEDTVISTFALGYKCLCCPFCPVKKDKVLFQRSPYYWREAICCTIFAVATLDLAFYTSHRIFLCSNLGNFCIFRVTVSITFLTLVLVLGHYYFKNCNQVSSGVLKSLQDCQEISKQLIVFGVPQSECTKYLRLTKFFCILCIVFSPIFSIGLNFPGEDSLEIKRGIITACRNALREWRINGNSTSLCTDNIDVYFFAGILKLTMNTLDWALWVFLDAIITSYCLMMHNIVSSFLNCLNSKRFTWRNRGEASKMFIAIWEFLDSLKNINSSIVIISVFIKMPFYSYHMISITLNFRPFSDLTLVTYTIIQFTVLIFCGQFNHLAEEYRWWLLDKLFESEEGQDEPLSRETSMILELTSNDMGLKGWRFFTITPSLLGNMLSFLLTLTIIIVQTFD